MTAAANTEYSSGVLKMQNAFAFMAIVDITETGAPTVGDAQLLIRLLDKDESTVIYELPLVTGIQTDVNGERLAVTWGYGLTPLHTSVAGGAALSGNADILKLATFMKIVLEVTTANDGTTSTADVTLLFEEL